MSHTPGPWHDYDEDGVITGELDICGTEEPEGICLIVNGPHDRENAALICAAPDLLAELEKLVYLLDEFEAEGFVVLESADMPHALAGPRRLIAKVRGEPENPLAAAHAFAMDFLGELAVAGNEAAQMAVAEHAEPEEIGMTPAEFTAWREHIHATLRTPGWESPELRILEAND